MMTFVDTLWGLFVRMAFVGLFMFVIAAPAVSLAAAPCPLPFVKQMTAGEGTFDLRTVHLQAADERLADEAALLADLLAARQIGTGPEGVLLELRLAPVELPPLESAHRAAIEAQAYRLTVAQGGIVLQGPTTAGVYYAIQTFSQLIEPENQVAEVEVLDWPDLAVRAIMVDAARANENLDYYSRVIDFCAHYKINRLHWHLTDDENASLYHEKYPSLMHPHAWRTKPAAELVRRARKHHIDIVPEIESLGHARLFLRHPDFRNILHQTTEEKPKKSWAGTGVPGYTNVLCPASEQAYEYLGDMYARAAEGFPFPETHIGLDEVDMTTCARCAEAFSGASPADWYVRHWERCVKVIRRQGRNVGLWGDMVLHHREIAERLPTAGVVIYDWHYTPKMTDESVVFFKQRGFTVIGCPALVCHPHMILPSDYNYRNIDKFAEIARAHDLIGLDTTVWTPTRYLSDVLWPGLAYAAVQSWGGSRWDEAAFLRAFVRDFFGSSAGDEFAEAWHALSGIRWWLDDFKTSCWTDEESLAAAATKVETETGAKAREHLANLDRARAALGRLDPGITRNREAWLAIVRSADILHYVLEHFLSSRKVRRDGQWDRARLASLDQRCVEAIGWIEADWDRNRFADDPYKQDLNHTGQHLLDWFKRMHEFHQGVLGGVESGE